MTDRPVTIEFSRGNRAAHLTLNRQDKNNAIDRSLLEALGDRLATIEENGDIRVVTIRGAGGTFSAGADLSELKGSIDASDRDAVAEFLALIHETLDELASLSVPTVAVIEGFALAGGLETVLACDLAVCTTDAQLGDQHANYGLIAGGGGTQRLPAVVGPRRAKELMFTGRRLDPSEAREWGLVNRVVEPDALEDEVAGLIDSLAEKSPNTAAVTKYLVDRGRDLELETGLELERERAGDFLLHADAREGLAAFAEGRDPVF